MYKISAVIITYNEALNIVRCIESVKPVADEIIILDSYSTDHTAELARGCGAKRKKGTTSWAKWLPRTSSRSRNAPSPSAPSSSCTTRASITPASPYASPAAGVIQRFVVSSLAGGASPPGSATMPTTRRRSKGGTTEAAFAKNRRAHLVLTR